MLGLYEALGGRDGCRKLSEMFYARVARDPILSPFFSAHFRCAIEALAAFLVQLLGGPCEYSARHRWSPSLYESHLRFKIGQKERDAWMRLMSAALDDLRIDDPNRNALLGFFEQSSAYLINDPDVNGQPAGDLHEEIAGRWRAQRLVDETVAAFRSGDADRVISLMESPAIQDYFARDRAALLSLLAIGCGSSHPILIDYVHRRLTRDPALAQDRYANGRTLLHGAAGEGSLPIVQLLLQLGADPNAADRAGHTPLYCVGNECRAAQGGDVVRALVQAGANVNTHSGVKRCTALHMAARRGNVSVAQALLECGANIEAQDSKGDSPLRRAMNCRKKEMAAFLADW
ncbi:MAG TPA: ankyrin repeat domain-containing protein [Bryobacteraceae bacterium]